VVGFFIQRPIFASAIAAILVLAGGICFFLLPISQFPEITPPQVVVTARYPGASAEVVADTVTTPRAKPGVASGSFASGDRQSGWRDDQEAEP
jgi:multidrug efflux pump subunit AcrB